MQLFLERSDVWDLKACKIMSFFSQISWENLFLAAIRIYVSVIGIKEYIINLERSVLIYKSVNIRRLK